MIQSKMNFPCPRKLKTPLTTITTCMSSNSKVTNHYETLDINQNATQEEIKSAYYKLTKQYHPDVNKTQEAKKRFQDVSEAYETLGNYKNRRQYDRGIIIRKTTVSSTKDDEKEPEHMAFYKSRMKSYPKPVKTADSKVYDFDAWCRAHYGSTLKKTISRRNTNINLEFSRQNIPIENARLLRELSSIAIFTLLIIIAAVSARIKENFDVLKKSEENKKESEQ